MNTLEVLGLVFGNGFVGAGSCEFLGGHDVAFEGGGGVLEVGGAGLMDEDEWAYGGEAEVSRRT